MSKAKGARAVDPSLAVASAARKLSEGQADACLAEVAAGLKAGPDANLLTLGQFAARWLGQFDLARDYCQALAPFDPAAARLLAVLDGTPLPAAPPADCLQPCPFLVRRQVLDRALRDQLRGLFDGAGDMRRHEAALVANDGTLMGRRATRVTEAAHGGAGALMGAAIAPLLPEIFARLGLEPFTPGDSGWFLAAMGDGDDFACHVDSGHDHPERQVTLLYYLVDRPGSFAGGDLLLHDTAPANGEFLALAASRIRPEDNMLVAFPSAFVHQVTRLHAPAGAEPRRLVAGWLVRAP